MALNLVDPVVVVLAAEVVVAVAVGVVVDDASRDVLLENISRHALISRLPTARIGAKWIAGD
jgi:hypothetical protein